MFEQRGGGLLSIVNFAHSVSPNVGALRDMTSKAVIIIQRLPILQFKLNLTINKSFPPIN